MITAKQSDLGYYGQIANKQTHHRVRPAQWDRVISALAGSMEREAIPQLSKYCSVIHQNDDSEGILLFCQLPIRFS